MRLNSVGQIILDENEIFSALYSGKIQDLTGILVDGNIEQYNHALEQNADSLPKLHSIENENLDKNSFDNKNQSTWFIPTEYKELDIEDWLINQCTTKLEHNRIQLEISLFKKYKMLDLLKCLKYIVDTLRANNILWGVGRGSSVASYALFLIGIHKIDSIKYKLDINEFLK